MSTTVITYIYKPTEGTRIMQESFSRFFPVINANHGEAYTGNGDLMRALCRTMETLDSDYIIYSDGADTICIRDFEPLPDKMVYAAGKVSWPVKQLEPLFERWPMPWRYVNGGNWMAPRELALEFFRKYILPYIYHPEVDGQSQQNVGLFLATVEGFPIELDATCKWFQPMNHEAPGDFTFEETRMINNIHNTTPAVLHFNGWVDPARGVQLYKNQLKQAL